MSDKSQVSLLNRSILLLVVLTAAGYAGNYFSYPFGFGVDFLFGSIAVLIIVGLYNVWWGGLASLIASSYTIILWQHPYALIIFVCEALFVGWRIRRGKRSILTSDMIFWICVGIPLVILFYGYVLQVGIVTTAIIALKQPVNGIFNALIASLLLSLKPFYRQADSASKKPNIFFEQILLNLLVAFVLIPALLLMVVNNRATKNHEETALISMLDTSAKNLATDLQRWHRSGLEALQFMAQTSSQTQIVVSGQTEHGLNLAVGSLPLFKDTSFINADREVIAKTAFYPDSAIEDQDFLSMDLPRIPQIFVLPQEQRNSETELRIFQTLPIVLKERWLGNIIAELNIDFIEQLLATEAHSVPLNSTLLDENRLFIASTDQDLDRQSKFSELHGEISNVKSADPQHEVYHWLPFLEEKPLIARWRKSYYAEELIINEEIPLILRMEAPAVNYIDYLQSLYIRSLAILLFIALVSILIAKYLSRLLVKPILRLAIFTTDLPYKILRNEKIGLPRSSVIEMNALINNFEVMSNTVEENMQQIQSTNQQLTLANEKSAVANKAKDRFLANISHELKTPLNSIIGYSRLVQKNLTLDSVNSADGDLQEEKSVEWLTNVQNDSKYLLTLIDEILDLAKSEGRKTKLNFSLVNINDLIKDIVVFNQQKAAVRNISFKYEANDDLPTNIYADEQRLRQVLLNLLNNAFKFTEQGQIALQISQLENTDFERNRSQDPALMGNVPDLVSLRFKIVDTGIGIARKDLTRIFQPFEQVDKYEVSEVGTGLGLSISKQLVELMGGKLNIRSEPTKGSVFWFDLTFTKIQTTSTLELQSINEIVGYQGDQRTILIVDDVKTSRLLLSDMLEPLGFRIMTAADGQQGLQLALAHKPDLVLTDLFMPIKTGFTLIAELRQNKDFKSIPIIAASASNFEEVERQSRASGCNAFLEKPINDQRLFNILGRYLKIEWMYRQTINNANLD